MRHASKLTQVAPVYVLTKLVHPYVFERLDLQQLPTPERVEQDGVLTITYRNKDNAIHFRCDGIRIVIEAFCKQLLILRCAIRDRQLDATTNGSPLTTHPNSDPACNRLPAPGFHAAELSIYSYDPDSYLDNLETPGTLGHFINKPDDYIWADNFNAQLFFQLWEAAFFSGRAPWQKALSMPGVSRFFVEQSADLLKQLGYHRVDAVPSWFNVAKFFDKRGYQFTCGEHQLTFTAIANILQRDYAHLSNTQHAWLVALQNIPEKSLPPELRISVSPGSPVIRWPVTHTNMYWVRMHLDLNDLQVPAAIDSNFCRRILAV